MDPPRRRLVTPRHSFTPRQSFTEAIPECQACESPVAANNASSTDDCPSGSCLLSWDSFSSAVSQSVETLTSAMRGTLGIGALWGLEDPFLQETRTLAELSEGDGLQELVSEVDSLPDHVRQRLTEALLPDKARISLVVANGNRIGIQQTKEGTHLVATAAQTQDTELFEVWLPGGGKVGLRSVAALSTWLTAHPVCDSLPSAFHKASSRRHQMEWKMFSVYPLGGDRIALRGHHGQYVTADGGGGGEVYCDAKAIGPHEVLYIDRLPGDSSRSLSSSVSLPNSPRDSEVHWWSDRVKIGAHVHDLHC